jgi:glutaredoxin
MPISITLLTQEGCAHCEKAERSLDHLAAEFDLRVRRLDVTEPEGRSLAETSGLAFAPGIYVDGELFSYGRLSERKLRRHLARHTSAA